MLDSNSVSLRAYAVEAEEPSSGEGADLANSSIAVVHISSALDPKSVIVVDSSIILRRASSICITRVVSEF